jgi:hypothetical protein
MISAMTNFIGDWAFLERKGKKAIGHWARSWLKPGIQLKIAARNFLV